MDRLGAIRLPTQLLAGRIDEATPAIVATIHQHLPGAEWGLFKQRSPMPHVEETERYLDVLSTFLTRVEAQV